MWIGQTLVHLKLVGVLVLEVSAAELAGGS
jgi:hypothetical protein